MNLMGWQHYIPIICALWKNFIQKLTSHGIVSDMVFEKSVDVGVTGTKHKKRHNTPDYQCHGRLPTVNTYSRSLITIIRLSTSYTGKSTQTSNSWHHPKKIFIMVILLVVFLWKIDHFFFGVLKLVCTVNMELQAC